MTHPSFSILGLAGSLRRESYNRALLRAAAGLAPPGVTIVIFERLGEIPPYNDDVRLRGLPDPVAALWQAVAAADALLVATPEYNYGVPGVLKNALDWVSRPPAETPLRHKPVAIMGASTGNFGTARAQLALRQTFQFVESYALPKPEVDGLPGRRALRRRRRARRRDHPRARRSALACSCAGRGGWATARWPP